MHPQPLQTPAAQPQQATLHEQFAASVAETKRRWLAKQAAENAAAAAQPKPAEPVFDVDAARAELAHLEATLDAGYQFADDRATYQRGAEKAGRIDYLRGAIRRHEAQGAAA